jgi:putative MATE family efflux protein
VLNVFLDILFVAVFGMGTEGVALATVIAQALSALLCFLYINRKVPMLRLRRKDLVFDAVLLKDSIRLGLPMAIQQSVLALGGLAVQGLVNSYGATTIAAYWAATRIDQIATTFILSIGMATTTFTGQNVGAGRLDRIGKGLRASMAIIVVICIVITGVVLLFGESLIGLFSDRSTADPAVFSGIVAQGAEYMRVVSLFYVVFGLMFCTNGVLRGSGDVMVPLYTTLAALSVRVAAGYALSAVPWIGHRGIWWSIPIAWVLSASISAARYLSGAWKKKALAAPGRRGGTAEAAAPMIVEEECL